MTAESQESNYGTAMSRWAGVGPYYAMFPLDFAFDIVNKYTKKGDNILDPFAGRASSIYAAAVLGRKGTGVEISPVGWIYGKVKLKPANKNQVLNRLDTLNFENNKNEELPEFFSYCYSDKTLKFLISARKQLDWKNNSIDRTLMAFILIYLHGKRGQALSNQMRQTKAMAPDYSIKWWKEQKLSPPEIDPIQFLKKRISWRYLKGSPKFINSQIHYGDSTKILKKISTQEKYDLLFTSPPYCGLTNYHYDQWLRLWMLGGFNKPIAVKGEFRGRFDAQDKYKNLLKEVFQLSSHLMKKNATIYVRTYAAKTTLNATLDALKAAFPKKNIETYKRPFPKKTQTFLFGDNTKKPGEVDIVLQ